MGMMLVRRRQRQEAESSAQPERSEHTPKEKPSDGKKPSRKKK